MPSNKPVGPDISTCTNNVGQRSFYGWSVHLCILFLLIYATSYSQASYSGLYGLYIEETDQTTIQWLTDKAQVGVYELTDENGTIISSGETNEARTHRVQLSSIRQNYLLSFGGKSEGVSNIEIRSKFNPEATNYLEVDSVYVLGDVHGRYQELIKLLKAAKVIDENLLWSAGSSHAVFLGDLFDRGDDVTRVLWFIYQLEQQAEEQGGKVHLVLGNHEIMTMTNDLRYVGRKELGIAVGHGKKYDELFHPLHSHLGKWLRSKTSVLRMGQLLFAHGGIIRLPARSLEDFNKKAYDYMSKDYYFDLMKPAADSSRYDAQLWEKARDFFYHEESPYWYRGYVVDNELQNELRQMLRKYDSKIHIVAHTPVKTISSRYNGNLLTTDLEEAATELLFLVKDKKKYKRYKIDSSGVKSAL